MPNPNIAEAGKSTQFPKGTSGNPNGVPKGTVHLATRIQQLLSNEDFEATLLDPKGGILAFKGMPADAIINVAIQKAVNGDHKMMDWLAKYGFGTKTEVEHSGGVAVEGSADQDIKDKFNEFLKNQTKSEDSSAT